MLLYRARDLLWSRIYGAMFVCFVAFIWDIRSARVFLLAVVPQAFSQGAIVGCKWRLGSVPGRRWSWLVWALYDMRDPVRCLLDYRIGRHIQSGSVVKSMQLGDDEWVDNSNSQRPCCHLDSSLPTSSGQLSEDSRDSSYSWVDLWVTAEVTVCTAT